MIATSQIVITKIVTLLLAMVATPMDSGDSIRVDRLDRRGVTETYGVEKIDAGYTLFVHDPASQRSAENEADQKTDKKTTKAQKRKNELRVHLKEDGSFEMRAGENVVDTVDLGSLLTNAKPEALSKIDDKYLKIRDGGTVRVQRRGEVLYLTSSQLGETYVVTRR